MCGTEGWFVDMVSDDRERRPRACLQHEIIPRHEKKLTSQHELAIWQPAWPTREQQESVCNRRRRTSRVVQGRVAVGDA